MKIENTILSSLEIVSNWDITDERLADAITEQARLMAGVNFDDYTEVHTEQH
jgi:hypothetical protein